MLSEPKSRSQGIFTIKAQLSSLLMELLEMIPEYAMEDIVGEFTNLSFFTIRHECHLEKARASHLTRIANVFSCFMFDIDRFKYFMDRYFCAISELDHYIFCRVTYPRVVSSLPYEVVKREQKELGSNRLWFRRLSAFRASG